MAKIFFSVLRLKTETETETETQTDVFYLVGFYASTHLCNIMMWEVTVRSNLAIHFLGHSFHYKAANIKAPPTREGI